METRVCYSGRGCACDCDAVTEEGGAVDRDAVWRCALSVLSMMLGSDSSRVGRGSTPAHHVVSFLASLFQSATLCHHCTNQHRSLAFAPIAHNLFLASSLLSSTSNTSNHPTCQRQIETTYSSRNEVCEVARAIGTELAVSLALDNSGVAEDSVVLTPFSVELEGG